jgi:uncharacterized phage infection (PIP) family protein YhgE
LTGSLPFAQVVCDKEGKVNTVRYEQTNAMLLNEFLKEHKKVVEQQATIQQLKSNAAKQDETIAELRQGMGILNAQLKEQAAEIQSQCSDCDEQTCAATSD